MNSTQAQLLTAFLADERAWHSGDQLAGQIGVSRESVWKAINGLRKRGYQIESRKNRGYRYQGSAALDELAIRLMAGSRFSGPITVEQTVTSTQELAKRALSQTSSPQLAAFFADEQTAGYGRLGRSFYSPAQTGLYFSLILPNPANDLTKVGLLTTSVAVSVLRVLQATFPAQPFGLKWVNDLYLNQRKVGGIITEASLELESTSASAFIVGIGLNLTTTEFPAPLGALAGGIAPSTVVDRNRLAATLISTISQDYQAYPTTAWLPFYRAHSLVLGKPVTVRVAGQDISGRAETIDENGALVVALPSGERRHLMSGEVTRVVMA